MCIRMSLRVSGWPYENTSPLQEEGISPSWEGLGRPLADPGVGAELPRAPPFEEDPFLRQWVSINRQSCRHHF